MFSKFNIKFKMLDSEIIISLVISKKSILPKMFISK